MEIEHSALHHIRQTRAKLNWVRLVLNKRFDEFEPKTIKIR